MELKYIIVALFSVLFICGFIYSTLYMAGQSQKFWKAVGELEDKVNKANSLEEVSRLYENDFKAARKLAMGSIHYQRLGYVFGMIKGKHDAYLKIKKESAN